jgi:hypothetical protein
MAVWNDWGFNRAFHIPNVAASCNLLSLGGDPKPRRRQGLAGGAFLSIHVSTHLKQEAALVEI